MRSKAIIFRRRNWNQKWKRCQQIQNPFLYVGILLVTRYRAWEKLKCQSHCKWFAMISLAKYLRTNQPRVGTPRNKFFSDPGDNYSRSVAYFKIIKVYSKINNYINKHLINRSTLAYYNASVHSTARNFISVKMVSEQPCRVHRALAVQPRTSRS